MAEPGFWADSQKSKKKSQKLTVLKNTLNSFEVLNREFAETRHLTEMASAEREENLFLELEKNFQKISAELNDLEIKTYLSGEYDSASAILFINAGAGGTDAQDWAEMLLRMYLRWLEKKGFTAAVADVSPGEEAGLKSATVLVNGPFAYGYLKTEKGIHRLVRQSPFNAKAKRQTSFAAIDVLPQLEDEVTVEVKPEEVRVDTFRSSGAGGQHVNKTDSAVRMTHLPTGIVVQCQNDRSQIANRETCLKILKAKLHEHYQSQKKEKIAEIRGQLKDIAWGNQIRSYVFHPYTLVKDHRTNVEFSNVQKVMDGELDIFIEAILKGKTS